MGNRNFKIQSYNKYKVAPRDERTVDGITFASKREMNRYCTLKILATNGKISELRCQVTFRLNVNNTHICNYIADFVYTENGRRIVEDVKSKPTKTQLYRIKKKLMRAVLGIEIREVF